MFTTSERSLGSNPSFTPKFIASAVPIIVTPGEVLYLPKIKLLHSFVIWPAPESPQNRTFAPICNSTGSTSLQSPSSPPTIKHSVPACAPTTPPDTGASKKRTLDSFAA
ncbi:hypothetical protein HUJ05_012462 [Dendroctonus ponderosae]|nr:hypothetical protein HUJ05_012462 [Dendroctonus ponderosae]